MYYEYYIIDITKLIITYYYIDAKSYIMNRTHRLSLLCDRITVCTEKLLYSYYAHIQ